MTHKAPKHAAGEAPPAPDPLSPLPGIDEFVSIAAHDLRNPIAVIRASAQMASRQIRQGNTEGAEHRVQAIVQQSDRLSEMLERFLDAARVGRGELRLRREESDFSAIVTQAVERAGRLLGPALERQVELDLPEAVPGMWDALRIERAVRALVENAYVYGDASEPVRVGLSVLDGRLRLAVDGAGAGPLLTEQADLFRPFFRGRAAAEAGHAGSGLGLFTARGIARAHGGDVRWLGPAAPTTFVLELPLSEPGS